MLDAHAHVMQVKLCKANTRGVTPTELRSTDSLGILVKSTCLCRQLVPASVCFLYTPTLQQQWRHPSQNLSLLRLVLLQVLFPAASILQAFFSRLALLRVRLLEFSVACACDLCCLCTFSSVPPNFQLVI